MPQGCCNAGITEDGDAERAEKCGRVKIDEDERARWRALLEDGGDVAAFASRPSRRWNRGTRNEDREVLGVVVLGSIA